MTAKISEQWFIGSSKDEREQIKDLVLSSPILLDKLQKILYNMQESKDKSVVHDYDTPSWSHKQAHLNGEKDAIRKMLQLVTITERDDQPTI